MPMEKKKMKYPIGVQSFEKLRTTGYAYVDKTAFVRQLVEEGNCYFLSRPRRFGKSLLLSTFEAYFLGKRELFRGLAIDSDEVDWEERPVIRIDFNAQKYDSPQALEEMLNRQLQFYEQKWGVKSCDSSCSIKFLMLLRNLHEKSGKRVAVLIDEYDKPLLEAMGNEELFEDSLSTLYTFYTALKSADEHVQFALLTGVTKFSKVSVFSGLNNLKDISLDERYAEICGLTEQEIRDNFTDGVTALAEKNKMTLDECFAALMRRYDGYHFTEDTSLPGLYNPFSVLNTLDSCAFRDYWFQTGTPRFLVDVLKDINYPLDRLTQDVVTADLLGQIDAMQQSPLPLLYQSGYLTIKDYDPEFGNYRLGFPNEEVERGFFSHLVSYYTCNEDESAFSISDFVREIRSGQAEAFMTRLDTFLADSNYEIAGKAELYFQNVMAIIFKMLGFFVETERRTSDGRMDIVMKTKEYIYIFELKLDGSAEKALIQIEEKDYARPFASDTRRIIKIGANFSSKTRHLTDWTIR